MDSARHWRTSTTDPLRIDTVAVPGVQGRIGMTICPGDLPPENLADKACHLACDIIAVSFAKTHRITPPNRLNLVSIKKRQLSSLF
jgi:hypothetical protein